MEDSVLAFHMEVRPRGHVVILHCKGRLVYRHEAAAFSHKVGDLLEGRQPLVVDFTALESIDSAGLGELVLLHLWAQTSHRSMRVANPNPKVRHLLNITNLVSILYVYATVEEAVNASARELARPA